MVAAIAMRIAAVYQIPPHLAGMASCTGYSSMTKPSTASYLRLPTTTLAIEPSVNTTVSHFSAVISGPAWMS